MLSWNFLQSVATQNASSLSKGTVSETNGKDYLAGSEVYTYDSVSNFEMIPLDWVMISTTLEEKLMVSWNY